MHMGAAAGALKEAANKDFTVPKNTAANGAYPIPISMEAIHAALDVHETILAAIKGWECQGTDQFAIRQFCRANRAGLGLTWKTGTSGFVVSAPAGSDSRRPGGNTNPKEQGIAEPEENDSQNYKNKHFQYLLHDPESWRSLHVLIYYIRGNSIYYRYSNREFRGYKF